MAKRKMILALAKLIIAAAWADGNLDHEEINNLKSLLLRLRTEGYDDAADLSGRDWTELDLYISSPVDKAERERLVVALQEQLRTKRQKQMAIDALRAVVAADGQISAEEQAFLEQVQQALQQTDVGLSGAVGRLFSQRIHQRRARVAAAPNRESAFDDFVRNKVYHLLSDRLRRRGRKLSLPQQQQRKLGLAGGLMAKIAHSDGEWSESERTTMIKTIQDSWALDDDAAALVADVALQSVDNTYTTTRMTKRLTELTEPDERRAILTCLFAVAAADGQVTIDEHEDIRLITRGLELTHADFIAAKQQALGSVRR